MKFASVVLAAGKGERLGTGIPKCFTEVGGERIIDRTLKAFYKDSTVVMVPHGYSVEGWYCRDGGETRVESFRRGVESTRSRPGNTAAIVVHDGARPFVTYEDVDQIAVAAQFWGAAGYILPVTNTVLYAETTSQTGQYSWRDRLRRAGLWESVTPQGFRTDRLYEVIDGSPNLDTTETELLQIVQPVHTMLLTGQERLFKITTSHDLLLAEVLARHERTVVVTGAAGDIGVAIVYALLDAGFRVVGIARTDKQCLALDWARERGAIVYAADISAESVVEDLFADVQKNYGLHIVINNAGVGLRKSIAEMTQAEWDHVMAVNLRGAFLCARESMRHMGHGSKIINLVSSSVDGGREGLAAYGVSKAGLVQLTEVLALEGKERGIMAYAVAPRRTRTAMRRAMFGEEDAATLDDPMRVAAVVATICKEDLAALSGQTFWLGD